jgi:hypothetical protein
MITKPTLAHDAISARYQTRREPMTIKAYLFLLFWVMLVLSVVDGLAAVVFHVG